MLKGQLKNSKFNFHKPTLPTDSKSGRVSCFSFGTPESVLDNNVADYAGVFFNTTLDYYEPPVSLTGLAKTLRANAHHNTIPYFLKNQLLRFYNANSVLASEDLGNAGFEYRVFGNCYFQKIYNGINGIKRLKHIPAMRVRKMKGENRYGYLSNDNTLTKFKQDEIIHLKIYDPVQRAYGVPEYFGGIQSVLLNESATLFRRKYYNNGAHMGYIFYAADAYFDEKDEARLKSQIESSKGVGNFRSMYLNIPGGKEKSIQIIPVGDIATKDEFERVKNLSRNDVISMWRIQPVLAGVMPDNAGGFGDIEKISKVYYENETLPFQKVFLQLNEQLPHAKKISFKEYNIQ